MRLAEAAEHSFARHETFHPRYSWFRKSYAHVDADSGIAARSPRRRSAWARTWPFATPSGGAATLRSAGPVMPLRSRTRYRGGVRGVAPVV